ncbi:MAG: protease complex subunit PrcB family protein, partial [Lentimicrobiaceae bacterium]|nr:protease complex subunit PrcB family protein [Lentimicrobiaceae bacterium]
INSGEDLENYIDGSYPEIDFSKQTLLLVGGSANNGISQISKSLQQLSGNEYKLDVELTLNDAAVSENWAVSMLVPKITNEVVVTLNVYLYQTTPTLVAKGDKFRGDCPNGVFLQVITTPAEWDTLLSTIPAYSIVADFVETTIDFTAYQVIVVIDEQRYSGGWTIDITDVTEYANSIVVTYTNLMNGNLASVITRPFHIVKIPVSNKQIIFQYEN